MVTGRVPQWGMLWRMAIWGLSLLSCGIEYVTGNKCVPESSSGGIVLPPVQSPAKWAIVALTKPGGKHDLTSRNKAIVRIMKPYASVHDVTALFFSEFPFPVNEVNAVTKAFKDVAQVKFVNTADRGFAGKERYGYKV
jgi:hypothetical protein